MSRREQSSTTIRPLGVVKRIQEVYISYDYSSILPVCFMRTCTGRTVKDSFVHDESNDAVGCEGVKVTMLLHFHVLGVNLPQDRKKYKFKITKKLQ